MKVEQVHLQPTKLPFNGKQTITSPFGYRYINGEKKFHKGLDIVGVDKQVRACITGKVIYSNIVTDHNNNTWEWGNYICIFDGMDYYYYCHLAERFVKQHDRVEQGDIIGIMGNTGYSFGEHLHFEVRSKDGISFNPFIVLGYREEFNATGTVLFEDYEKGVDMNKIEDVKQALWNYQNSLQESEWSKKNGGFEKGYKIGVNDGTYPQGIVTRQMLFKILNDLGLLDK